MSDDYDIDIAKPFAKQTKKTQEEIVNGGKGRGAFVGLVPYLKELWLKPAMKIPPTNSTN